MTLISSGIDISLDEWKLTLLSLHITSISVTMGTFLMDPLDKDRNSWGKSGLSLEGISTLLQNFSAQAKFWWYGTWVPSDSLSNPPQSTYLLHGYLSYKLSNYALYILWQYSQSIGYNTWISEQLHIWPFLFSRKLYNLLYFLKLCLLWRFLFTSIFQGCPRKRLQGHSCSLMDM